MKRFVLIMVIVSVYTILLVISMAEARPRSGRVTIRHSGYTNNNNRSTHRIRPTVPLDQGNRISEYPEQTPFVGTFPVRTYIPRRRR